MILIEKTVAVFGSDTYSAYLLVVRTQDGIEQLMASFHLEMQQGSLEDFIAEWTKYATLLGVPIKVKLSGDDMKKQPMTSFVDLDSVTIKCPCGASITGEGECIAEFFKSHKPHSNGTCCETITDDGARVMIKTPPRIFEIKG